MKMRKFFTVLPYILLLLGCVGIVWFTGWLAGGGKPGFKAASPANAQTVEEGQRNEDVNDENLGGLDRLDDSSEATGADFGDGNPLAETENHYRRWHSGGNGTGLAPTEPEQEPYRPPTLMLASDLHFMSRQTHDDGKAFQDLVAGDDGKVSAYSEELLEALIDEALRTRPSALVLTGDVTLNGERENHEELARRLRRLTEGGVPVLMIPGNHDIQNHNAATYFGAERTPAEYLKDGDEFYQIYHEFGYDQAIAHDFWSLSYVYALDPQHWMLMLDSCQYENGNRVNGRIRSGTMEWMKEVLQLAWDNGIFVLPVAHHNLLSESRMYTTECTLENSQEVVNVLEQYQTPLYISGHLHAQRIKKHYAEPGTPKEQYGITEIVLGPYSVPPCQYGYLSWNTDGGLDFETRSVDMERYATEHGLEDPFLLDFSQQAPVYMKRLIRDQVMRELGVIPRTMQEQMANLYAKTFYRYCAGEQIDQSAIQDSAGYQMWQRIDPTSTYVERMEEMAADNPKKMHSWNTVGEAPGAVPEQSVATESNWR